MQAETAQDSHDALALEPNPDATARSEAAVEEKATERPRSAVLRDVVAVLAFLSALLTAAWRVMGTSNLSMAAIPIGLLLGYLLADALAGGVHWLADRYFEADTRWIGPILIAPFRAHHVDPTAMTRHDFFEVSGNTALVALPVAIAAIFLPTPTGPGSSLLAATTIALLFSLFATNQFHAWAHDENPPRLARRLQRMGLILTPERHRLHHGSAEYDRAYCVTSGWLNPALDRVAFFPRLERMIDRITKGVP